MHAIHSKEIEGTKPLYANLARALQAGIRNGVHRPGSKLPGEHELAEMHGVSRATVRAALGLLERKGLLERRRGAGTVVLEPRPPGGFGQSVLSMEELIHYARDTRRIVRSVDSVVVDEAMASGIGARPGSRWLQIASIRVDPARRRTPICAGFAYIDATLQGVSGDLADETSALCDLISRRYSIQVESIEQELQGAVIQADLTELLNVAAGTPALRILRHYRDVSGRTFMITVSLHPADRFAYRMRLDRRDSA